MFFGCSKIKSLDLSNFNFENVVNMGFMFSGCKNLEYINLYNYNDDFNPNIKGIFLESYDYLILLINNSSNTDNIILELNFFQCLIYNSFFYFENNNQKIIYDSRKCVNNCKINEIYKFEYENFCYKECPIGSSLLNNETYLCGKKNVECFDNFPFLNIKDNSCVNSCNSEDFFKKKCSLNNNKKEIKEYLISNIIKEIDEGLMNEILSEVIREKNDLVIKEKDLVFQITTSFNQNNKEYQNLSTINLGEVENQIKEKYNISQNESLIIFKVEKFLEGMLIPIIKYEIFHPLTKEKLDLNFYDNKEKIITIYTPVNINENEEYKYNLKSNYYNDICESFPIESIDLTLYERKNEYFKNNMSLCQNYCIYFKYDFINKKSICQCNVQEGLFAFKNNDDNSLTNFNNKKNINNFKVLKCLKLLFSKEGLIKNIGNYIISIIILLYMTFSILFYLIGYDGLCEQIKEILNLYKSNYDFDKSIKEESKNEEQSKDNYSKLFSSLKNSKEGINKNNLDIKINLDSSRSKDFIKLKNEKQMYYIDYEINNFTYEEAKDNDKRTFLQYYISLLKSNNVPLFVFNRNDYNSKIIKICIILFSFALFLVINCLFFNDSLMNRIYKDRGSFNLIYNLPNILYSTIISSIIIAIVKSLSLSQNNILEIKRETNQYKIKAKSILSLKCLIIKYIIFFVANILSLLLFWFYLSSFCAVYKNTQIYLIKNNLFNMWNF